MTDPKTHTTATPVMSEERPRGERFVRLDDDGPSIYTANGDGTACGRMLFEGEAEIAMLARDAAFADAARRVEALRPPTIRLGNCFVSDDSWLRGRDAALAELAEIRRGGGTK